MSTNNSSEITALNNINRFRDKYLNEGYSSSEPQKENYCYSIEVDDGNEKVKIIIYFGKKGIKTVLQGNKTGSLYRELSSEMFGEKLFNEQDQFNEPDNYIGTDESGKGDYFGPLVTAGVLVDPDSRNSLQKIGVRDSKELSDILVKSLSFKIKKILKDKFSVVKINPEKYNSLYSKISNVNNILGWAHARVIENILNEHQVENAISDKFGNSKTIMNALLEKGKKINLRQESKAEKYTAVAAASILARAEVINWFDSANKKYKTIIPKGASSKVEETAVRLMETIGEEEIKKLIKFHFKTSKKIFNK